MIKMSKNVVCWWYLHESDSDTSVVNLKCREGKTRYYHNLVSVSMKITTDNKMKDTRTMKFEGRTVTYSDAMARDACAEWLSLMERRCECVLAEESGVGLSMLRSRSFRFCTSDVSFEPDLISFAAAV